MFKRYANSDFKTPYARHFLNSVAESMDYDAVDHLSDDLAQIEILDYIDWINRQVVIPPHVNPSTVTVAYPKQTLSDGREVSTTEILKFREFIKHHNTLRAYHAIETGFEQARTPEEIIAFMQKSEGQPEYNDAYRFREAISFFPLEATFIRTELQHPEMLEHPILKTNVLSRLQSYLSSDMTFGDSKEAIRIGFEEGPRNPELNARELFAMLKMWDDSDRTLTPVVQAALYPGIYDSERRI